MKIALSMATVHRDMVGLTFKKNTVYLETELNSPLFPLTPQSHQSWQALLRAYEDISLPSDRSLSLVPHTTSILCTVTRFHFWVLESKILAWYSTPFTTDPVCFYIFIPYQCLYFTLHANNTKLFIWDPNVPGLSQPAHDGNTVKVNISPSLKHTYAYAQIHRHTNPQPVPVRP